MADEVEQDLSASQDADLEANYSDSSSPAPAATPVIVYDLAESSNFNPFPDHFPDPLTSPFKSESPPASMAGGGIASEAPLGGSGGGGGDNTGGGGGGTNGDVGSGVDSTSGPDFGSGDAASPSAAVEGTPTSAPLPQPETRSSPSLASYGNQTLHFEKNQGQTDSKVQYLARGQGYNLYLTQNSAVFTLAQPASSEANDRVAPNMDVMAIHFAGANPNARVLGISELTSRSNYGSSPKRVGEF